MNRVITALLAGILIVIVVAKFASNMSMDTASGPVNPAWVQDKMEFVTWNSGQWTAWIHDGDFQMAPVDTDNWSPHSSASLAFRDWHGEPWQAKIDGSLFLLAKYGDWQGQVQRSDAIRYLDWQGNKRLRTVAELKR